MSKTKSLHHIVFSTKCRELTLDHSCRDKIYHYLSTLLTENDCTLYCVNGIADHMHFLFDLNPTLSLAGTVKMVKSKTSYVIRTQQWSTHFKGWARGYYGCSISPGHVDSVMDYIKSQEEHHKNNNFNDELERLFRIAGLNYHEDDLMA